MAAKPAHTQKASAQPTKAEVQCAQRTRPAARHVGSCNQFLPGVTGCSNESFKSFNAPPSRCCWHAAAGAKGTPCNFGCWRKRQPLHFWLLVLGHRQRIASSGLQARGCWLLEHSCWRRTPRLCGQLPAGHCLHLWLRAGHCLHLRCCGQGTACTLGCGQGTACTSEAAGRQ